MRSSGIAARRNPPPAPPAQQRIAEPSATPAFTLQQVITMLDSRLTNVEKQIAGGTTEQPSKKINEVVDKVNDIATYMTDVDARFNMLIDEIDTLKNTILLLQTYTMDVNKKLVDERFALSSPTPIPEVVATPTDAIPDTGADDADAVAADLSP